MPGCVGVTNEPNLADGESGDMSSRWGCYEEGGGLSVALPGADAPGFMIPPLWGSDGWDQISRIGGTKPIDEESNGFTTRL